MDKTRKLKKGNGELIGFAITAVLISSLFILMVSFLQMSISLNSLTKAVRVTSRSAAICTSMEDAEKQAQLVAETAISNNNMEHIHTTVEMLENDEEWRPGALVKVTVDAVINTIDPLTGGRTHSQTVLVAIENATGLRGGTVEEQVWNYLRSQNFSAATTAGIMGNMYQESGVDPTNIQGGGAGPAAGIVQWEGYTTNNMRWKTMSDYAAEQGKDWTDLKCQLDFMILELQGLEPTTLGILNERFGGYDNFISSNDVHWATRAFMESFERAGNPSMSVRYAQADHYYSLYH